MKVSLRWLSDYLDLPTEDPAELRKALETIGHKVEGTEILEVGWTGVDIAEVLTVEAHPQADRVRVCTVRTSGEPITVICGAWNFEAGAIVAFANPGAVLPGDFEIGVRTIRGVESHGMICSEKELGLGDDAEGILVLDPDSPVGAPFESIAALPDVVLDLEITPNRPDAMSLVGIARDLAAWYGLEVRLPAPVVTTSPGDTGFTVDIEDSEANPRFVMRRVDGVTVGPSPLWMRQRLRAAGVRPISNLVDVTNYVMMELGQPLHVFDADKIAGGNLTVRRANDGEKITTLDGATRDLSTDDIVICDANEATSLAGTMGGLDSEVSASTTSTLIEAASWHSPSIMRTSRRHGLRSEASARFERGVDPNLPPLASLRAAELVLALAGGELREGWTDEHPRPREPVELTLTVHDVERLLGPGFDSDRVGSMLERLGFITDGDDPMAVTVPSYRPDVTRPVDLVEEVARFADFDTFEEHLRLGRGGGLTEQQTLARRLRQVLVAAGCSQAVSLSFVMPSEIDAFDANPDAELQQSISVKNPLSDEEAVLRPSLLPGLLRAVRHNRNRGQANVALFEEGRVFRSIPWSADKRVPHQPTHLAIAGAGTVGPTDLDGDGQSADVNWILATIRHIADILGLDIVLRQGSRPGYHPTRTAEVLAGDVVVGHAGELHPMTAEAFAIDGRVAVAELDLALLLASRAEPSYLPPSPYPPVDFDLSFEVEGSVPASDLVAAVSEGGGNLVESVNVFDEFHGGDLGEGQKALALRVRLRAPDRTLEAGEITEVRQGMVDSAASIGAGLRGAR